MTKLLWDQIGERVYQLGVDRGVFYSPLHMVGIGYAGRPQGFSWSGLVSVDEVHEGVSSKPIFFNGIKTFDVVTDGDFSAKVKALTYPDEFMMFDGYVDTSEGLLLDSQPRDTFGLSYRTMVGNDVDGTDLGYKIHILYNLTSIADDIAVKTVDTNIEPIEFGWTFNGTPEPFPSNRPTAHLVIDSRTTRPEVLSLLEDYLYGTESVEPRLPTVSDIIDIMCVVITEDGAGTWTATGPDYLIEMLDANTFQIDGATIGTPTIGDYKISSTYE